MFELQCFFLLNCNLLVNRWCWMQSIQSKRKELFFSPFVFLCGLNKKIIYPRHHLTELVICEKRWIWALSWAPCADAFTIPINEKSHSWWSKMPNSWMRQNASQRGKTIFQTQLYTKVPGKHFQSTERNLGEIRGALRLFVYHCLQTPSSWTPDVFLL